MAKPKKLPSSSIVTQANELVSARYILPVAEQRLVLTMISRIQPEDEDFKPYHVSIGELAEFLGISKGSVYSECKKITKSLLSRVLEINASGRLLQTHWVSSADYVDGSGKVVLSIDPLLKPYLLQLKGNFTSFKLDMVLSFKSQYTMRIYSLLKQNQNLKTRQYDIQEFREILGLREDQHKEYKHVKFNILRPVKNELDLKSDLTFVVDEIKSGRQVVGIKIYIQTNTALLTPNIETTDIEVQEQTGTVSQEIDTLLSLVPKFHKNKKSVQTSITNYHKKHGADYVNRNIRYSNEKSVDSYPGFLANALKNDWGHDWKIEQQNKIKQKPIEIWERQGFKSQEEYDAFMYERQMQAYTKTNA